MARREWTEQQVDKVSVFRFLDRDDNSLCVPDAEAVKLLRKEHARAVRIVKAEIKRVKKDQHVFTAQTKGYLLEMLNSVLAALERGRTARRK